MQILKSRAEWLAARQQGIGASDAAAILGVSPWKGALQLFHEKKGTVDTGSGETFARTLGLALETPIAKLYADKAKRLVYRPPEGTFELERHATRSYMVATLDGRQAVNDAEAAELGGTQGVVEIKTAAISKAALWTNEAPIDYQVQVQHQLAVTGLPFGTAVALVGGVQLLYSDIKRDQEFIDMLEAACEEFWRRLELNDPPPVDGTEATKEFLKKLYPIAEATSATLPPEAIEWDQEREAAHVEMKLAQERKQLAENKLRNAIGANVQGILPNGVIYTMKPVNRAGYTVQPTSYRDFRRKGPKGEKVPKIAKGTAPSIADIEAAFKSEQEVESNYTDARDISFD